MTSWIWKVVVGVLFVSLAMFVVFSAVLLINRANWVPIEAVITANSIEPQQAGGLPDWALMLEVEYRVEGSDYRQSGLRIRSHAEYEALEQLQHEWAAGNTVEIYYDDTDPESSSLYADGGRQGIAVVSSLFVPLVLGLGYIVLVVLKRRRKGITGAGS